MKRIYNFIQKQFKGIEKFKVLVLKSMSWLVLGFILLGIGAFAVRCFSGFFTIG